MYHDSVMQFKPRYRKIGTYFGIHNAEKIADEYRDDWRDVVITFSYTNHGKFNFYSVWVKDYTLEEVLSDCI